MNRTLTIALSMALSASSLLAQAPVAPPQGLDALTDDRLLSELAGRNLPHLLDRAFEINKVPQDRRNAVLARVAFTTLRQKGQKMPASELDRLVAQAASGIRAVLPLMDDPSAIMEDVTALLVFGVQRDLNILEYWGENPRTQAKLKPVVEAIVAMTARAAELARDKADKLAEAIRNPNDQAAMKRWQAMDTLAETAAYTGNIVRYYLALSLDKADPERARIARDAADYLEQFDVEDNPDRPFVRTLLGKLSTALGGEEGFSRARAYFDQVIAETTDPAQQYDARYFRARVEVEAGALAAAREQNQKLDEWTRANLPNDPGVQAADMMLEYRIFSLEAAQAKDAAARDAANAKAVETLVKLVDAQPSLRPIIFEQLVGRLPAEPDMKTLNPLLLEATLDGGWIEALKDPNQQADAAVLKRAIAAAREMLARPASQVPPQKQELAAFLLPFMLERAGDNLAAAAAYVDYVERYRGTNPQNAAVALTNAEVRLAQLRRTQGDSDELGKLEDRLLPIAVAEPFNRGDLLFRYGYRLQQKGKPVEAIAICRKLPADDPNYASSRYLLMVLLNQQLADLPTNDPRRAPQVQEILKLAEQVTAHASASIPTARNDRERAIYRARLVGTKILAADIAQAESNDPERALRILENLESEAKGLPNETAMVGEAMNIRVRALRDLNRLSEAAEQLKRLTETGGEAGVASVVDLLKRLDEDYDKAYARDDRDAMRRIADSRAMLTPELVRWAKTTPKQEFRKFVYRYSQLDADSQRLAAELADDPAEQKRLREAALERYRTLESEENFRLFIENLPPERRAGVKYDPSVVLGIGRLEFELGNYVAALGRFQKLLEDRTVGSAIVKQNRGGVEVEVDNDVYWETVVKFIRSNLALGDESREPMTRFLKLQYVTWRERTGGVRWKKEMDALRQELAPGWQIPPATTAPSN